MTHKRPTSFAIGEAGPLERGTATLVRGRDASGGQDGDPRLGEGGGEIR